jgi:hypothetical protein
VGEEPEEERKGQAKNEARDDGEVESGVFAAVDDVTGESSEAEGEFAAKEQKSTNDDEETSEEEQGAAEFAERIHKSIIEEGASGRREQADGFDVGIEANPPSPLANRRIEADSVACACHSLGRCR